MESVIKDFNENGFSILQGVLESEILEAAKHERWSLDFRYQDANQPTLRKTQGHLLRLHTTPEAVVKDAKTWAELEFS